MENIASVNSIVNLLLRGGLGAVLLVVLAAVSIWWRTRSGHTVMFRIWSFFSGNKGASIPSVKRFYERQGALLQFRFTTGLKVRTVWQMESVIDWGEKNNEDLGDVATSGVYFDLEKPGLRDSVARLKIWAELLSLLFFVLVIVLGMMAIGGILPDRALLQLKETSTWMTLGDGYAKPFSDQPGFKLTHCGKSLPAGSGFTSREQEIICGAFTSDDTEAYVHKTVNGQRWALGGVAAFLLFFSVPLWWSYKEISVVRAMYRRLARRIAP